MVGTLNLFKTRNRGRLDFGHRSISRILPKLPTSSRRQIPRITGEFISLWRYGISQISDRSIRAAVVSILENEAPWTFFVLPASLSGMHHPKWQGHSAGILRNTVECCVAVERQMRIHREFTDARGRIRSADRDVVMAATILSDIFKYGTAASPYDEVRFQPDHGMVAAERWKSTAKQYDVNRASIQKVYDAIYWHLGRWTPGWNPRIKLSLYTAVTHSLDMFFSDKNLELLYRAKTRIG